MTEQPQPRAGIYACAALSDPREALTAQVQLARAYAEESGYVLAPERIYQDRVSPLVPPRQREQCARLLEAAASQELDVLLVTSIDRLSPESGQLEHLLAFLRTQQVEVIAVAWDVREVPGTSALGTDPPVAFSSVSHPEGEAHVRRQRPSTEDLERGRQAVNHLLAALEARKPDLQTPEEQARWEQEHEEVLEMGDAIVTELLRRSLEQLTARMQTAQVRKEQA